ncbi:MAG: DsbE family thiol:disulfide interchange protein, partial [Reyranellales bacterium]
DPFKFAGFDMDGKLALDWGLSGVPETYLIDGQGIVRLHFRRPINERDVTEAILPLLRGGS